MALKQTWEDKVDGVDDVLAEDINSIARAVIENEENISLGKAIDEEVSGQIGDVSKEVESIYETLGDYSKRITNIEEQISPRFFYTDDGVAYKKNIPAKACPYALLTKLGGMTYRHQENLAQFDLPEGATRNADGSVSLTQTIAAGGNGWVQFTASVELDAGTYEYSISGGHSAHELTITGTSGFQELNGTLTVTEKTTITFADGTYKYSAVEEDTTETITMSISLVNTVAELRDSKVTALKVHSKNLFNGAMVSGCYADENYKIDDTKSPKFRSIQIYLPKGTYTLSSNGNISMVKAIIDGVYYAAYSKKTFTTTIDGYVGLTIKNSNNTNWVDGTLIQIERGETATEYAPFGVVRTIELPEELQGDGVGVDKTYHNYVDIENKKSIVSCRKYTFTGAETWSSHGATDKGLYRYSFNLTDKVGRNTDGLCNKYPTWNGGYNFNTEESVRFGQANTLLYLYLANNLSVAEVATLTKGMEIIYPLAEPIETDITTDFDNFIEVDGGGSIEFVNEYEQAVPSEISYMLKES